MSVLHILNYPDKYRDTFPVQWFS